MCSWSTVWAFDTFNHEGRETRGGGGRRERDPTFGEQISFQQWTAAGSIRRCGCLKSYFCRVVPQVFSNNPHPLHTSPAPPVLRFGPQPTHHVCSFSTVNNCPSSSCQLSPPHQRLSSLCWPLTSFILQTSVISNSYLLPLFHHRSEEEEEEEQRRLMHLPWQVLDQDLRLLATTLSWLVFSAVWGQQDTFSYQSDLSCWQMVQGSREGMVGGVRTRWTERWRVVGSCIAVY